MIKLTKAIFQMANLPILDLRRKEFLQQLAECLKAWTPVDDGLFVVYKHFVADDKKLAGFLKTSTGGKLLTTDTVLRQTLQSSQDGKSEHPKLAAWEEIKGKITELLRQRNSLAHDKIKLVDRSPVQEIWTISAVTEAFATATSDVAASLGVEEIEVRETELPGHLAAVNGISEALRQFLVLLVQ